MGGRSNDVLGPIIARAIGCILALAALARSLTGHSLSWLLVSMVISAGLAIHAASENRD